MSATDLATIIVSIYLSRIMSEVGNALMCFVWSILLAIAFFLR